MQIIIIHNHHHSNELHYIIILQNFKINLKIIDHDFKIQYSILLCRVQIKSFKSKIFLASCVMYDRKSHRA